MNVESIAGQSSRSMTKLVSPPSILLSTKPFKAGLVEKDPFPFKRIQTKPSVAPTSRESSFINSLGGESSEGRIRQTGSSVNHTGSSLPQIGLLGLNEPFPAIVAQMPGKNTSPLKIDWPRDLEFSRTPQPRNSLDYNFTGGTTRGCLPILKHNPDWLIRFLSRSIPLNAVIIPETITFLRGCYRPVETPQLFRSRRIHFTFQSQRPQVILPEPKGILDR